MSYHKAPRIGYLKLEPGDFIYFLLGVFFIGLAGWGVLTSQVTLVDTGVSFVQLLAGVAIIAVTLLQGRWRIQHEERVNPVRAMESARNHALAEGITPH